MVYSTCTFSREENEAVVESLLTDHQEMMPADFMVRIGSAREPHSLRSANGMLRIYPHRVRGEGHFVALLYKRDEEYNGNLSGSRSTGFRSEGARHADSAKDIDLLTGIDDTDLRVASRKQNRDHTGSIGKLPGSGSMRFHSAGDRLSHPRKPILEAYADFCAGLPCPTSNAMLGDTLLSAPDLPPLQGVKVLRAGLHLGTLKGKVFVPDHALAMAMPVVPPMPNAAEKVPAFQALPLSPEQARAYLRGETLSMEDAPRGYGFVTYEGLTLGFGKGADGQVKNHYPKGLRRGRGGTLD